MLNDLRSAFRPAFVLTVLFALLLGIVYPLALTLVGWVIAPAAASGSLVRDTRGQVIGSALIGQSFTSARYFHGRPSAAGKGYDATASSGSNLGPASQALADRVKGDLSALHASAPGTPVPADLVTASASGLDPDLSPEAALYQVDRVAAARRVPAPRLRALIEAQTEWPLFGFIGEAHVNVLALNLALDRIAARP